MSVEHIHPNPLSPYPIPPNSPHTHTCPSHCMPFLSLKTTCWVLLTLSAVRGQTRGATPLEQNGCRSKRSYELPVTPKPGWSHMSPSPFPCGVIGRLDLVPVWQTAAESTWEHESCHARKTAFLSRRTQELEDGKECWARQELILMSHWGPSTRQSLILRVLTICESLQWLLPTAKRSDSSQSWEWYEHRWNYLEGSVDYMSSVKQ